MFKNFFVNPFEHKEISNVMTPSYVKEDGTKVYEKKESYGHVVYEVSPNKVYIARTYSQAGHIMSEYARDKNLEIGRQYDESERISAQIDIVYDENNKQAMRKEYSYTYYDNGSKKSEKVTEFPEDITKVSLFDEKGNVTEMYEQRGSVKIWYDDKGKPVKREIDRGSGGIITEDLHGE